MSDSVTLGSPNSRRAKGLASASIAPKWCLVSDSAPGGDGVLVSALLWDEATRTSPPGIIYLGTGDTYWTSHDGKDWTAAPAGYNQGLSYRQNFCAESTLTGVRLFGGDSGRAMGDLWSLECGSPPGGRKPSMTWKREPDPGVPPRLLANLITTLQPGNDPVRYGDCQGEFIIGGQDGRNNHLLDVWRSSPAYRPWTEVPQITPYQDVQNAAVIAWRGCIWRFGGRREPWLDPIRDVYASGDNGATWWRPFTEVPWSGRSSAVVVALGDCLVLVGGSGAEPGASANDCWIFDGSYWTQGPPPPGRLGVGVSGCTEAPLSQATVRQRAWFMTYNGQVGRLEL